VLKKSAVETYKDRKRSARSFNIHHEVGVRNSPAAAGVGLLRGLPTPAPHAAPAHWSAIASPEGRGLNSDPPMPKQQPNGTPGKKPPAGPAAS